MHVLITGVSGFIGSHLAHGFAQAGLTVTGLYRRGPGLAAELERRSITLLQGDIATLDMLPWPVDAVVHAAGSSAWTGITTEAIVRDNVVGTRRLLELVASHGCSRFVFLSSMSAFGEISQPVVDESTPVVNPDVYGTTKLLGEELLKERQQRLSGLTLRLPGVVGRHARRNWMSTTAARLKRGEPARLYGPESPFNNAVHIDTLTGWLVQVIQRGWSGYDTVVLGAAGMSTIGEVVQRLAAGLGVQNCVEHEPVRKQSFTLSSARAIERWGYEPLDIDAVVDRYAADP